MNWNRYFVTSKELQVMLCLAIPNMVICNLDPVQFQKFSGRMLTTQAVCSKPMKQFEYTGCHFFMFPISYKILV